MASVRRVTFSDDAQGRERFQTLYEGFVAGGDAKGSAPGMIVLRREGRILDKLDAVSQVKKDIVVTSRGDVVRESRVLKAGEHVVTFESDEYDLVKKYFESCPWTTTASRRVSAIFDWFSEIPQEKAKADE